MSWSGTVQIHGVPGTGYPDVPKLYTNVSFGDITRNGSTISCNVSASIKASGSAWFGYRINVYAQLDNGPVVLLYSKGNSPKTWGEGAYSGSGTISSTNDGESATLKILFESNCGGPCSSAGTPYVMWSTAASAPPFAPPNITLESTGYTATSLSWKATADVACDSWVYTIDGSPNYGYGSYSNVTYGSLNVSSAIHSVAVSGHRPNGKWGWSNTVTWDCRIPEINNVSISPLNNTTGTLSFYSNFTVLVYWEGVYIGEASANNIFTNNITLQEGKLRAYNLKVARKDNTAITNSRDISVDMLYPIITLEASVNGIFVEFSATMDKPCKNVYAEISWGKDNSYIIECPSSQTSSWNYALKQINGQDLVVNTEYSIKIIGTRADNNVTFASNIVKATPLGCIRVYQDKYDPAGVWIWTDIGGNPGNYKWTMAIPYIYDKDKGWISAR